MLHTLSAAKAAAIAEKPVPSVETIDALFGHLLALGDKEGALAELGIIARAGVKLGSNSGRASMTPAERLFWKTHHATATAMIDKRYPPRDPSAKPTPPKITPRKRKLVGIREAINYLALNAEEDLGDEGGFVVPVVMIAHLFDYEPEQIAEMVEKRRIAIGY